MFLAVEQLIKNRDLGDEILEPLLRDLLSSAPDWYGDEKIAFAYG